MLRNNNLKYIYENSDGLMTFYAGYIKYLYERLKQVDAGQVDKVSRVFLKARSEGKNGLSFLSGSGRSGPESECGRL